MAIFLTFAVNAGLNFALGLLVAWVLGPEAFGRFSLAFTAALVINTALFEWLRLCATRFYSERARADDPSLRATLNAGYAGLSLVLAALTLAAGLSGLDLGLPASLMAGTAAAGFANGLFEYQTALARARFLDGVYARLVLAKNALAVVLMVGGAALTRDPAWVMAGAALSALAAIVPAWRALADPAASLAVADARRLAALARYGVPIIGANVVYQLLLLGTRGLAASGDGFAAAGRLALATDLGLRLLATLGAALDVYLFQLVVRAEERDGRAAAERQAMRNAAIVLALLAPVAAGYLVLMPAFEAALVPAAFRGEFAALSLVLVPGLLAFALTQFAVNPAFQLARRTGPALASSLAAAGIGGAILVALPRPLDAAAIAGAHAAGLAAGFLVAAVLAGRLVDARPRARDLAGIAGATALMAAAAWPLRDLESPLLALAAGGAAGGWVYGAASLAADVAGLRTLLVERLRARGARPQAAG